MTALFASLFPPQDAPSGEFGLPALLVGLGWLMLWVSHHTRNWGGGC